MFVFWFPFSFVFLFSFSFFFFFFLFVLKKIITMWRALGEDVGLSLVVLADDVGELVAPTPPGLGHNANDCGEMRVP